MKKYLLIATALVALASCSDDTFVGENSPNPNTGEGTKSITFGSGLKAVTRASYTGKAAADLLNNEFVFAGTKLGKETTPVTHLVYDQYYAKWVENTANTTESNSNDWEYVGYEPYGVGNTAISALPSGAVQVIKYWDYNTTQYDFAAYSLGKGVEVTPATTPATYSYATASKIDKDTKSYTLTGKADELKACYISDLVTYYNRDGVSDYGKVVNFSFRSLAAKVRLAFYETVPGYSVKSVQFYNKAEFTPATGVFGNTGTASNDPRLLNATDAVTLPTGEGTMTITFPTTGFTKRPGGAEAATDYNKAHIAFTKKTDSDLSASMTFGTSLADFATEREGVLDPSGNYIGRASNTATYAGGLDAATGQGQYYTVLPNESPANLMIRIKYTLVATDGSGEEITVDNASAVIPAELAKWSPNYAYTYIFKISDMTNGSTGVDGNGKPVCGLTPITLNAVVVDSEDGLQETITTVSHPSITTYAKGKVVTENDEYEASTPIYVIVNNGTSNVNLTGANAKLYKATVETGALQGITDETVDNALRYGVIGTDASSHTTYTVTDAVSPTGKKLVVTDITPATATDWLVQKILAADSPTGNEIVLTTTAGEYKAAKFTPSASTVYVFQYKVSDGTANDLSAVVPAKLTAYSTYYTLSAEEKTADGTEAPNGDYYKLVDGKYIRIAPPASGTKYYALTATSHTADGSEKIVSGGTVYYTMATTYELVQSVTLIAGRKYYTSSAGAGEFTAAGTENPKTTNYYEKIITYTKVPYATLTKDVIYFTSDRGAGAFKAVGTEVVDAENKYYSGTLGIPAKYQYKIIKVQ